MTSRVKSRLIMAGMLGLTLLISGCHYHYGHGGHGGGHGYYGGGHGSYGGHGGGRGGYKYKKGRY